jgi:hypothetical protein
VRSTRRCRAVARRSSAFLRRGSWPLEPRGRWPRPGGARSSRARLTVRGMRRWPRRSSARWRLRRAQWLSFSVNDRGHRGHREKSQCFGLVHSVCSVVTGKLRQYARPSALAAQRDHRIHLSFVPRDAGPLLKSASSGSVDRVRNAIVMRSGTAESRRAVTMMGRGQVVRRGSLDPVFEGSNPSAPANSPSPVGGGPLEDRADG